MSDQKTILYIEDNPDNRLLVRRILHASGFRLLEAEHASKALEILQQEIPDLILMDINMPEMDGYTLTAKLEAGCDGYIQKPVDVDTFPDQIAKYIKR